MLAPATRERAEVHDEHQMPVGSISTERIEGFARGRLLERLRLQNGRHGSGRRRILELELDACSLG